MNRTIQILCGAAILVVAQAAMANLHAQSGGGFFAYKDGVTLEQEAEDHQACHDWAVAQSGFRRVA